MSKIASWMCGMVAGIAALPLAATAQQPGDMSRVEVRHYLPVGKACPDAVKALPLALSETWPVIDALREVQVEFKLDGNRARDVKILGGHGENFDPVRRAVRSLDCRSPGDGAYAVRFRIKFEEPKDDRP